MRNFSPPSILRKSFHLALVEITKATWPVVEKLFNGSLLLGTHLVHAGNDEEKSGSNGSAFLDAAKAENDSSFVFLKNKIPMHHHQKIS